MYEKIMYKVETKDNKLQYRLQDFTKNDNVDESVFVEAKNKRGETRLECNVFVLHVNEYEAIFEELEQANRNVEELKHKIKQKNVEIKTLQGEIDKYEQGHKDEEFNIMLETRKLEKQHQGELDELKETHEKQLLAIDESHKETLKQLRAHYTQKLEDANEHLFQSVKANGNARDKLRVEMLHMKQEHDNEVNTLQKEHHNTVEKLQHAHSNELQDIREQHANEVDTLKETLAAAKQEHLVEVNEINERHHVEVEDMRTRFARLLANEHAQDLSDFNECGEPPRVLRLFARGFVESFNEFKKRKELNTPQKIVETYELKRGEDDEMSP